MGPDGGSIRTGFKALAQVPPADLSRSSSHEADGAKMRLSRDEFDSDGNLVNGFDYDLQVWVLNYLIQGCGHPMKMRPGCCLGARAAGIDIREFKAAGGES